MSWHHTNAHTDHQQSCDVLICHGQTSGRKLRHLARSNHLVVSGKVSTSTRKDSTRLLMGSLRWKQRNRFLQGSRFHSRLGVEFVPSSLSPRLSPSSRLCHRLLIRFLAQQVLTLFLLTLLAVSLSSHSHVPLPHTQVPCAKPSHQACFSPSWFLTCTALLSFLDLHNHGTISTPTCPFPLTGRPGLHSPTSPMVSPSLQVSPGAPLQARSGELSSHIEQTWCQANWKSCDLC